MNICFLQIVEYEADVEGYRPQIRYEGESRNDANSPFGGAGNYAGGYPSAPDSKPFTGDYSSGDLVASQFNNQNNINNNNGYSQGGNAGYASSFGQEEQGYKQNGQQSNGGANNGYPTGPSQGGNQQENLKGGYPKEAPANRGTGY